MTVDMEDLVLEALQHNGSWMTLPEVQVAASLRSSAGTYTELQRLVALERAESYRRSTGQTVWKAIMKEAW